MARVSEAAVERHRQKVLAAYHASGNEGRKRQKESRDRAYENRSFIGWDGEGYTDEDGAHHYMLFGASTGYCVFGRCLSTRECLDAILYVESLYPDAFHVGFAFEYDVNMILKDVPWRTLGVLYDAGKCKWEGYRIEHTPHKTFRVSRGGISATIFDVFGFFHSSYITALRKYRVGNEDVVSRIQQGKSRRDRFTYADIKEVYAYWREEISLLPDLMDEIRVAAYGGGYRVHEWHGPGALAAYALRYNHVSKLRPKGRKPAEVSHAVRSAYAGGRFQAWRCGLYPDRVYTADINSAYIFACSLLPNLATGRWIRKNSRDIDREGIARFGLYKISFDAGSEWETEARKRGMPNIPLPLFHRDRNTGLSWPARTEGWYWSPEARLVHGHRNAQFLEAWVYDDDGTYPFQWVHDAFNRRLILQRQNNPAEKAYKWALAAMYGAFARRVGWNKAARTAPVSHQLEWAGFITSWCRAAVFEAAHDVARRGGLVSIDTDGVTSTVPFDPALLPNGVGDELGMWKLETFSGALYWQNGIYWLRDEETGEWEDAKTRGVPKGKITIGSALAAMNKARLTKYFQPEIKLHRTRFIGYRQALRQQHKKWRRWLGEDVKIIMGGSGKGRHVPVFCAKCYYDAHGGSDAKLMHTITHFPPKHLESEPHRLPWLEEQPGLPKTYNLMKEDLIFMDDMQ